MSDAFFASRTHYIDSSYIREYPHALANEQEDTLRLAVKQYVPRCNSKPSPGDVTLIAAHANGVGKELYEPLWDDLLQASQQSKKFRIRSIWIADVAWQGESGVLNETKLGNDPSWCDHPRDLLHFINVFRKELPRPLMGVGHSMGGNHITNLALMHPRLLSGLILIDPVIQKAPSSKGNVLPAVLSTYRRDQWPSREDAEAAFRRNKFYQSWDARCFDQWLKHCIRELPTAVYPSYEPTVTSKNVSRKSLASATAATPGASADAPLARPVTLTTTKYQEVYTFLRGNYPSPEISLENYQPDRKTHPDIPDMPGQKPLYRPEPLITFSNLPHLRPPVLYMFASEQSMLSESHMIREKLEMTGTGVGGNGGVDAGGVDVVDVKGVGHFLTFEKPGDVAGHMESWLSRRLNAWQNEENGERKQWAQVPEQQKRTFTKDRLFWTEYAKKEQQNNQPKPNL